MKYLLFGIGLLTSSALASERCVPLDSAKETVSKAGGVWIGLTSDQLQFARGLSAMHPMAPVGIPLGDSAAMATSPAKKTAVIFFIDGAMACDILGVSDAMAQMVRDIGAGAVKHEGDGL